MPHAAGASAFFVGRGPASSFLRLGSIIDDDDSLLHGPLRRGPPAVVLITPGKWATGRRGPPGSVTLARPPLGSISTLYKASFGPRRRSTRTF